LIDQLLELLKGLPREWVILILSAVPIVEVRGAVPLGFYFGLSPLKTYVLSVIGSALPIMPLLLFLKLFTSELRKILFFDRFFGWLFARTRAKGKVVQELETIGLLLFVAIPLPGTGVWTGCLAAYLFDLPLLNSFIAISVGTAVAAGIMLLASVGVINFFL